MPESMNIGKQVMPGEPLYDDERWIADLGQANVDDWLKGMFELPEGLRVLDTTAKVVRESRRE